MNPEYAVYCDADRYFYDAPRRVSSAADTRTVHFPTVRGPLPEGWERHLRGDWAAFAPVGARLPAQGWKIHVSAGLDNAASVLDRVAGHCFAAGVPFKCLPSPYLLHMRSAKYADRAGSGKFLTVYPADEKQCEELAGALDALLAGEHGPYVLSDLRWGAGPVYLRYGAFAQRYCYGEDGALCPAVEDPEGRLVPDLRGPAFRTPDWVEPPDFLRPHLEARAALAVTDLPYAIEGALHFSNGGGVYLGRDKRTDARVVLKEARPYAGLAADGADAVARLEREYEVLRKLAGLPSVPEAHELLSVGEHRFLVMEYVAGTTLNTVFARRFPLAASEPGPEALAEHAAWALRMHGLVEEAVAAVHARGLVFSDLHMSNVMVAEDESAVFLLDFEAAAPAAENRRQVVANPAFVAPADRRGTDIDRYALACLRLALFLPLTTLLPLDRAKAAHLADLIAARYPVDRSLLDEAVREIGRGDSRATAVRSAPHLPAQPTEPHLSAEPAEPYLPAEPTDWPAARDSMVRALLASATFDREDRCFPGDIAQFASPCGGQSLGYGAAGVLYALDSVGTRCPDAEEWLLLRSKRPASGTPLGLYDGLTGTAWTLWGLGHREHALELAHLAAEQALEPLAPDLHSGLAGIGLALGDLAEQSGDGTLREASLRCAELAVRTLAAPPRKGGRAGLLHGAAGTALLCLRTYERTGDPVLLEAAAVALRRDLARCRTDSRGALLVDEGRRTMPYLGAGSTGIGMVLDAYLEHREDEELAGQRPAVLGAALSSFYVQPGLFRGVAGLLLHLAQTSTEVPDRPEVLHRQAALLGCHAVPYQGELAFPGEQLSRLSMDLSTGTAGVLLALGSALGGTAAHLPFLPPTAAHKPVLSQGRNVGTPCP
ncbi:class III lanthionine synthetase LanKC [Streptomyces physcomitrii]|uniref:class III lanthionine synthetase LanKC n=1 Tax=Streptomyces physcomitrii TaxID=2724184 RepID=UPI0033D3BF9D